MSVAWAVYRLVSPGLGALAPWARVLAPDAERALWLERMGEVRVEGGCDAWIHAASLGEAMAVGPLASALLERSSAATLHLSATTRTGRARLRTVSATATLAPIDAPQAARRFFHGVRPGRVLLVETELWPHWLLRARAERVPVAVVSARLSERSRSRYLGLGGAFRSLVRGLEAVLCQTEEDRARWLSIGARREVTAVVGNLKHDALPSEPGDRRAARVACGLDPARPALVLGSLRPGEARIVSEAWATVPAREAWQVVAVPRHEQMTAELRGEASRVGADAWRWDDRPGVLNDYYAAADVAIVGGTLGPYGGHNPMEPAARGCAVIVGPHHRAQEGAVRALSEGDAVEIVADTPALGRLLRDLTADAPRRDALGERALAAVERARGAARRAVERLVALSLWPPP